ncbi:MAG: UvrD-helicase domain-containing protein, partial [Cyanobacteria bacterium]|nr:UvrD-helicase domain-containing protein [Cyanobacteriota bacterium]
MTSLTDQQQEAVFSVDKNVLVSAGAGSGKTHVLVERYIEILRNDPELSTDNLIAVTFTRKAAGEMRSRLKRRFKELVSQGENSERWQSCLFEIDSARIGTIHSLCEAILRAFPAESKVDPNFEIIDEVSQAELIDESIEQAFREIVMAASPELELLELLNIDDIRRWLRQILKSSSQFIESANRLFGLDDAQLLTRLNETRSLVQARLMRDLISQPRWRSALSALDQLSFNGKLEEQRIEIVAAARLVETIDQSTSGTIIGWPGPVRECSSELPVSQDRLLIDSEQATDSSLELDAVAGLWLNLETISSANLRIGGNSDVAKEIKNAMRTMRELVQDVAGKTPLPAVISTSDLAQLEPERLLHSLFLRTKALFQDKKREDHKLDYDDLIHLAYESLSHPGSISRQYFQDRVRAILVDEFQDTNKLQSALVSLFASQRTRLFLIGDDKQSIYKFQGADVSNFNEWKEFIEGRKDEIYGLVSPAEERLSTSLNRSFRSHPQVVDFINLVFSNLMEDSTEDASYRASFQSLEPQRKPAAHTDPNQDATGSVESIAIIDMPAEQASLPNDPAVAASEVPARVLPEITEKSARKGAARKSVRETSVVQLSLFASFANLQDEESGPVFDCAPEPSDRSLEVVPVLANAFSVVQNDKSASLAASVSESGEPNEVQPFRVTEVADETASSDEATQLFEPVQIVVTANDEESPSGDADKLHEARCVAQWIAEMVRGSAPIFNSDGTRSRSITYGDCAVLVPKNSDFEDLELALAELNIPFITFAGRGFLHRQEILDLENLLYFLGNSADNHALFGVLRSPLFAVSDDILHEVCTANEVRRLDT